MDIFNDDKLSVNHSKELHDRFYAKVRKQSKPQKSVIKKKSGKKKTI